MSDIVAIGDPATLSDPIVDWAGQVELGATFEEGNTDELDLDGSISTTRSSDKTRLTLLTRGEYTEKRDVKTDNSILSSAKYEYDLGERIYLLATSQLEYDEFEDLDLRVLLGGDGGYFVKRKEHLLLKGIVGIVYQHEEFADGSSSDSAMLPFGYEFRLDLRERVRFSGEAMFFTNLTTTDDWRWTADNALEVPVSSKEALKVRLGVRNKYDNEPRPGIEEMDTTVYS